MAAYTKPPLPGEPLAGAPALEKIVNFMSDNFSRLALGGEIASAQLRAAAASDKWSPAERPYVDALNSTLIQHFKNETQGVLRNGSGAGLNREEVNKVKELLHDYSQFRQREKQAVPLAYQMANYAVSNWNKLDADHDGRLGKDEIDTALRSVRSADERLILAAIKENYSTIMHPRPQTRTGRALSMLLDGNGPTPGHFQSYLDAQYLNSLSFTDRIGESKDWAFKYDMLGYYENMYRATIFSSN